MEAGRLRYLGMCLACPDRVLSQEAGQRLLVSWEETTGNVTSRSQRVPSLKAEVWPGPGWFGRTLSPFGIGCECCLWEEMTMTAGCRW